MSADEVSIESGSDRVATYRENELGTGVTRSLSLPVLTSKSRAVSTCRLILTLRLYEFVRNVKRQSRWSYFRPDFPGAQFQRSFCRLNIDAG